MRPETWLDELAVELAARGVSPTDAAEIVVEAEGHLQDAAAAPLSAFGSPAKYAALVVDALEPPSAAPPTGRVRVQAHAISKWDVLRDQDVELRDGQALLLMGANGAGKTTLLRILAGLLSPDAGELTVAGSIGYAPQDGGLIEHLKPAEHFVLFGRGRGLTRTQAIREGARLADQLGWDALSAPTVGKLSGGTRQKLNVVLAALGEPDILLLDEPYQGLDRDSVQRFWELLWTWRDQGRCALVASHAHDAVERADAVLELQ